MTRKTMPMQAGVLLRAVPWKLIEHLEGRAQKNHGQTLERLAQRHGLDPTEMLKLLNDEDLFPFVADPQAETKIMALILAHQ